jgi:hypothetical protein
MATNKALIVLQENSGVTPLDSSIPPPLREQIRAVIDRVAETFEDVKMSLQVAGRYDVIYLLTDNSCSRPKLLDALVDETKKERTIDLVILGHGSPETLYLKKRAHHLTGGADGTIQSLLPDAKARGVDAINLRMVYMCNCYGSTVNDDWLAAGAKVSVGSLAIDWIPEPMTTFFMQNWLAGQTAGDAAKNAYEATVPFYLPIYPPTAKVTYKTMEITYPCPTLDDPFRTCTKEFQVPDGVEFVDHTNIQQSKLIVGGDPNSTF